MVYIICGFILLIVALFYRCFMLLRDEAAKFDFDKNRINQKPSMGEILYVYYPKIKRKFRVEVSSVRYKTFTARFLDDEDELVCNIIEDYGQYDNDVIYDIKTRCPVDRRKHAKY